MNHIDIIRLLIIGYILYKLLNFSKETYNPQTLKKNDKKYIKVKDRQHYRADSYIEGIDSDDEKREIKKAIKAKKDVPLEFMDPDESKEINNPVKDNLALHAVFDNTKDKFLDAKHNQIADKKELSKIRPKFAKEKIVNGKIIKPKCLNEISIKDIHKKLTEIKFEKLQVANTNQTHTESNHNGIKSFTRDHIKYVNDSQLTTGKLEGVSFQAFDSDLQNIESVQNYYQNIENN